MYCPCCQWFLFWNTMDGVFSHVFLALTWNLICCAQNTSSIQGSDVHWITSQSMKLFFGHLKTDQLGENTKYPQHLFANPNDPVMCPVLALSFTLVVASIHLSEQRVACSLVVSSMTTSMSCWTKFSRRKTSMIFPLVSCCSCINNPSSCYSDGTACI